MRRSDFPVILERRAFSNKAQGTQVAETVTTKQAAAVPKRNDTTATTEQAAAVPKRNDTTAATEQAVAVPKRNDTTATTEQAAAVPKRNDTTARQNGRRSTSYVASAQAQAHAAPPR